MVNLIYFIISMFTLFIIFIFTIFKGKVQIFHDFSMNFQVSLLQPSLFFWTGVGEGQTGASVSLTRRFASAPACGRYAQSHLTRGFFFDGDTLWLRKLT